MANLTHGSSDWTGSTTLTKKSSSITLPVGNKFVDKDIILTTNIQDVVGSIDGVAVSGNATAVINNVNSVNATTTKPTSGTAGNDYWEVKATATGAAAKYTPKYTVTTAGWLASTVTGSQQTVSVNSDTAGKSLYIPKATFTVFEGSEGAVISSTGGYIPAGEEVGTAYMIWEEF